MRTTAIIQARTGSTRLPGKVLMDLEGKTVLSHVVERVGQAESVDEVIVATTDLSQDDDLAEEANRIGVSYIRGSEDDVLSRYYEAAVKYQSDIVVRVTSDCPVIDPHIIDSMVNKFQSGKNNFVTNAGPDLSQRTFPRGMDVEVFSFEVLEDAYLHGDKDYHREHVTPYLYENLESIFYFKQNNDDSELRLTLDTKEDWELIKEIYKYLYKGKHNFYLREIRNLFKKMPELKKINYLVIQKKVEGKE